MHKVNRDGWNDGEVQVHADKLMDKVDILEQVIVGGEGEEGNGEGERGMNHIYSLMGKFVLMHSVFNEVVSCCWVGEEVLVDIPGLFPRVRGGVGDMDDDIVVLVGLGLGVWASMDWICMSQLQCT